MTDKDLDLLEKFFQKTLSKTEEKEFANLVSSDEEFASELAWELKLRYILALEQEKKTETPTTEDAPIEAPIKPTIVRKVLEPLEEEPQTLFAPKVASRYGLAWGWAIAASLAILVFGYWGFDNLNKTYNPKIAGIVAYGAEEAIRLPDDNPKVGGEGAKDKVEVDFDDAHYGDAIARYEDFLAKNAQNTEGGAVKKRIEFAEWKLTLVYYVSNDKTKNTRFLALLNQIAQNPNHAYHTKAVELKQKVNSFWGRLFN